VQVAKGTLRPQVIDGETLELRGRGE